ncbi:hypothetical protein E5N06_08815 [Clostridium perfringens]|uniref:hypothetical protein n=3 Tax=Clostridium perfringens TaxID=1502 RepID=UPI000E19EE63|nr:hypothetical protein [Clostridium perfringens]EGT3613442.1 hypothetical protein [Clostridium perfringens]MDM0896968.1 hypothetical protein [Clostridium perfringens]SUY38696.1 Uncharacterised protein [Clostridium perfringens]HBZ6545946.1 hypothetical protein [Clostridium perfringens]
MKYYFNQIKEFRNPITLFFLCGVKYNNRQPELDKRVVLKKYLMEKNCHSIILEENFVPRRNGGKLSYSDIYLNNLNDVETLACMIVDGVFIIHESHSTAAEIALFASNEVIRDRIFILVPDEENSQTRHYSGFLSLAYKNLLPNCIEFIPAIEKYMINNEKIEIRTYFNENKIRNNLERKINCAIENTKKINEIKLCKSDYGKEYLKVSSYYIKGKNIYFFINCKDLRYYIIALFSIKEFRNEVKKNNEFIEVVILCEKWFREIILNTAQRNEKFDISNKNIIMRLTDIKSNNIDLRKTISFIFYIFHALNWIEIYLEDGKRKVRLCKKTTNNTGFKYIYDKYSNIILKEELINFEGL